MEKNIIIYHRDMDGLASALIAKKVYPDAEMKSVQYGEDTLSDLIEKVSSKILDNRTEYRLIIVDFCFEKTDMEVAQDVFKEFIWIDHHSGVITKMPELWNDKKIKGIRSIEKSACELTWDYFFPDKETPYSIKLIGDRDTWKFKYGEDTKYFNEYLRQFDIEDETDIHYIDTDIFMDADEINDLIDEGEISYDYMMAEVKRLYKKGYIWMQGTHKEDNIYSVYECHSSSFISELANYALEQGNCDIAEIRQRIYDKTKNKFITVVSLRSKKGGADVSKIAQKYGGGGHENAAGYSEE